MVGIKQALSIPRLEGYRQNPSETDIECLKRYVWNVSLSEALYPTAQFFEIALRNAIHNAASSTFGNDFWFDNPKIISNAKTLRIISEAKGKLSKQNKNIEPDRIVAELHFGFWRTLFYNEYESKLWRPIIKDVFPNAAKKQRTRTNIATRVDAVHRLRNRISHHEPIWYWNDLAEQHEVMIETIGWINGPLKDMVKICDRFDSVYNMDTDTLRPQLEKLKV